MSQNSKLNLLDFIDNSLSSINFEEKLIEDNIYLVCRGTTNKQNFIAENFNISNREITHIGIGLYEKDSLNIYNISIDKKINNSSLIIETLKDFISINDIFHIEIWEINANKENKIKLKSILNRYIEKEIGFDHNFDLNDNENLYCSEFVAKILNELNIFKYHSVKKKSNRILKKLTEKEEFEYFPVDFFIQNSNLTQVYRNNLTKNN